MPFALDTPPVVTVPAAWAGVVDRRGRFREVFCAVLERVDDPDARPCDRALWRVGEEPPGTGAPVPEEPIRPPLRLLLVSGYGAQCFRGLVRLFDDAEARLRALDVEVVRAPVTAFGSVAQNAEIVARTVRNLPGDGRRLVVLGYSKGAADVLKVLTDHPDAAARIAAVVTLAGAVGGSPLAEVVPRWLEPLVDLYPGTRCETGDDRALADLRPCARRRELLRLAGPPPMPVYALAAFVPEEEVSAVLRPFWARLASVDPRNDGMVLWTDQVAPGSRLLGYLRGDHLAVAMPVERRLPWTARLFVTENAYPRIALIEAILRTVAEDLAEPPLGPAPRR
ncbi:hypothetical protein HRbin39_01036 [bacterium HR39]|nr:hypothetical protein HRbin39_01036 [bacterium HR39]